MKPKVLVVDDDPLVLESVRRQLQTSFEVETATEPAVTLKGRHHYDAVLADYYMPSMNGADYLAEVRRVYPSAARLLMTGGDDLEIGVRAVNQAGIHGLLKKPLATSALLSLLLEHVGGTKPSPSPAPVARPVDGKRRVLVVDDSETALDAAKLALEEGGYEVFTSSDPFQLIRRLRHDQPDVLLLDVNMPALDGPPLLASLRGYDFLRPVRVFLYSSLSPVELEREVGRCGADGYLVKGGDDLAGRLDALLLQTRLKC